MCITKQRRSQQGWTLIELLVAISIIGLLIGFMVPRLVNRTVNLARVAATRQQMEELARAMVGDPRQVTDGEMVSLGYRGDVGGWPPPAPGDSVGLTWLWMKPPSVPAYNFYTHHGWNGPYIKADSSKRFLDDSWENPYRFIRDSDGTPLGLESAGPDGNFAPPPPEAGDDNIKVMF